jgi:hypothetical protein
MYASQCSERATYDSSVQTSHSQGAAGLIEPHQDLPGANDRLLHPRGYGLRTALHHPHIVHYSIGHGSCPNLKGRRARAVQNRGDLAWRRLSPQQNGPVVQLESMT